MISNLAGAGSCRANYSPGDIRSLMGLLEDRSVPLASTSLNAHGPICPMRMSPMIWWDHGENQTHFLKLDRAIVSSIIDGIITVHGGQFHDGWHTS